jgi:hypothetical protein
MSNIIFIHGTGGDGTENWFPWLRKNLEASGHNVLAPRFPTPENQTPATWFEAFKEYNRYINEDTVIVAHSLGGAFLLRLLESIDTKILAAFFVSASVGVKPIKYYEGDKPFVGHPFDWKKIKSNSQNFYVFHSDNDPLVCLGNAEKLSKELGTDLILVPNGGHLNEAAGFLEFDLLYEKIKQVL